MEGASERARARGLEAVVTTNTIPGMGHPNCIFVLAHGTRLAVTEEQTLLQIPPSGRLATITGYVKKDEDTEEDGTRRKMRLTR